MSHTPAPRRCDLHTHSTASDGTDPPEALAQFARDAGLDAFALTDHDTTAGLPAAQHAADALGIGFVPGIELSADPAFDQDAPARGTLHILGYGIQPDHPALAKLERWLRDVRADRNPGIVEKLNDLGLEIDYAEVQRAAQDEAGQAAVIGRPHIAQVMVQKGYAASIPDAFARYIGEGAAAHVRKDRLSPADAIDALHRARGLAVLAHPVQLRLADDDALPALVARLVELGLDGIEAQHSDHTESDVKRFQTLAQRFGLLTTGGSDYHGKRKDLRMGTPPVPMSVYDQLRNAHRARISC